MIFNTLDTQVVAEDNHDASIVSTDQPVYLVLEKVLPLLADIVKKWRNDSSVIQVRKKIMLATVITVLRTGNIATVIHIFV